MFHFDQYKQETHWLSTDTRYLVKKINFVTSFKYNFEIEIENYFRNVSEEEIKM